MLALCILLRWWFGGDSFSPASSQPKFVDVLRVVDGDTLLLVDRATRIRLQGVDAPETVKPDQPVEPWGPEARAYTVKFLAQAGNHVRIDVDGGMDHYGRLLAFVWHDDRMLNEELVRRGLARILVMYDYSAAMKDRLLRAQIEAQREKRGIWSKR